MRILILYTQVYTHRRTMKMYLVVLSLIIALLYRPTNADHDSGEIDFGDSDSSFINPYERYSQSKLTGGQLVGRTISLRSGQFGGQSDDKEDVQYVYVSPSGGQMIGQNTGQFNSQTLGSPGGQLVKNTDDDQFVTVVQANGQMAWQRQGKTSGKTVYTPSGLFTNNGNGQIVSQTGGQINTQSAGQTGLKNFQSLTHAKNMAIDIDNDQLGLGQQVRPTVLKAGQSHRQLSDSLSGHPGDDDRFVFVDPNTGQAIGVFNGQPTGQNTISHNIKASGLSSDKIDANDDRYLPLGMLGGQSGPVNGQSVGQTQVPYTVQSIGQSKDTIFNGEKYVTVDQLNFHASPNMKGQLSGQNTLPYTAGQSKDKNDKNDDLIFGQVGGQAGIFNGQLNGQFAGSNIVPYSIQSNGQLLGDTDKNDDAYLNGGHPRNQVNILNGPNVVPYTIQSNGQKDKNDDAYLPSGTNGGKAGIMNGQSRGNFDKNDDTYLPVGSIAAQAGFLNGLNGQVTNTKGVSYSIQNNGHLSGNTDKNDDTYLPIGNIGGQVGIANGQVHSPNIVPHTIQASGHLLGNTDKNDDDFLANGNIGGQAGIINNQMVATPNVVPYSIQSNGQFSGQLGVPNVLSNLGGQSSVFNGQLNGQNILSHTIQSSDDFNNVKNAQFVSSNLPITSGNTIISINSNDDIDDDDDDDDDDDNFSRFNQFGGQIHNQLPSPSFPHGGGNVLNQPNIVASAVTHGDDDRIGQQNIVHSTVHMSGSLPQSVGQTVGQTHRQIPDQPLVQSVVQANAQFVSSGHPPVMPGRLSIGQYPRPRDDHPDSIASNPTSSYRERDVDAGGMCNNYKTKGGWAYRPIYGSCNQYLQCNNEQMASLLTCAAGTFYDGSSCRHSAEVFCPYDPCQAQESGFKYTDGQSCYGYYKCVKGKSRYHTCPDGFYFNSQKQICIADETCQKNNLIHPCSYGTTYPFPGRPEMFYLYDGREIFYPMKCPQGLWYRPDICSCDWIVPGISGHEGCKPMYHFQYNGNFLEAYNRIQQVPNTGVAIYRKSALFSDGGQIMIWAMNNMNLDKEFAFCFEFMAKIYNGEVALLSNGYKDSDFTYKITYLPAQAIVKAYIELDDGTTAHLVVKGVIPLKPHFVRLAKYGPKIKLRIDNLKATYVKTHAQVQTSNSPLVIGTAEGCKGFVGHFDEFKFFKCVPNDFFNDYAEKKK
ncbi:uncharacterized protein [Argopecten irradians]|uniref:uncharacterized protein n=1 Tax=Argopecten irradians TaxID=31199 RepID=UPI00371499C8